MGYGSGIVAALLLFCWVGQAMADDTGSVQIQLRDGTMVIARLVEDRGDTLVVVTNLGVRMAIPADAVASQQLLQQDMKSVVASRGIDPGYSRLMLAPTGRPLAKGGGYFSDHYVFFPAVAYGFTDHVSLLAGMTVFPGVGFGDQLRYFAPRWGTHLSARTSVSVGSFIGAAGSGNDSGAAGIGFIMATHGDADRSLTLGLGLGWAKGNDAPAQFLDGPILGIGFYQRLGTHTALVSESWMITGEGVGLGQQPLALAWRFFSGNLAVDVGVILIGELLQQGFPIPWLSFAYHFGH